MLYFIFLIISASIFSGNAVDTALSQSTRVFISDIGTISVGQSEYKKPKYTHEPTQLSVTGKIANYNRTEPASLTITSPGGRIFENQIFPTKDGSFSFYSQLTKDHASGEYKVRIHYNEITIGPATFKIISYNETTGKENYQNIPDWIRTDAERWSKDKISNNDFVKGIEYLINNGMIKVPPATEGPVSGSNEIPSWLKKNAGWWAEHSISTNEFVMSIQYLIEHGIIKLT